jgi:hypothetical protein
MENSSILILSSGIYNAASPGMYNTVVKEETVKYTVDILQSWALPLQVAVIRYLLLSE